MTDQAMRSRIMARLPPDEAAWLAQRLPDENAQIVRAAAIHGALAAFPSPWPTLRAKALQRALDGYLLSRDFITDRRAGGAPAQDTRRRALFRLALANDGKPLGWRRIYDIETLQENRGKVATARW